MDFIIEILNDRGNWHLFFIHNGITVHTADYTGLARVELVKDYANAVVEHSAYLDVDTVRIEKW